MTRRRAPVAAVVTPRRPPAPAAIAAGSSGLWLVAALVLAVTLLAAGCGGPRQQGGDDGAAADGGRRFLSLGTAPPGGTFFVIGGALADTLAEAVPEWRVTAEATKGTQENIRRLDRGELDLALANAAITYFAVRGEGGWERAYPMRTVMTLAPNVALFVTPQSSGVRRIADLAGRRVVMGPAGAGFEYFLGPILAAHDLSYDDLSPLYNTQSGAVDMLADGAADAAFLGGGVPTQSITQAASSGDVYFVPYDGPAMDELVAGYPFFDRATIPAGTYRGQDADYRGLNVGSMHLIAAAAADPDTVYRAVRAIWENRERVVERHAAGRAIRPEVVVRDTGTPFHPGAERFYREAGLWPTSPPAP